MSTKRKAIRVYADTSVFGGVFDESFSEHSKRFFSLIDRGYYRLVTSSIVRDELVLAPDRVREIFSKYEPDAEVAYPTDEVLRLRDEYFKARIIEPRWAADALHVAIAAVNDCNAIVSWNFKHIANYKKIPLYNAVNVVCGYHELAIYTPIEVFEDD